MLECISYHSPLMKGFVALWNTVRLVVNMNEIIYMSKNTLPGMLVYISILEISGFFFFSRNANIDFGALEGTKTVKT